MTTSISLISWNVNGLQSVLKRDHQGTLSTISKLRAENKVSALTYLLQNESPDILCLQEIRCSSTFNHCPFFANYPHIYTNYAKRRKGYSGTLIATKIAALRVYYDFEQLIAENTDLANLIKSDDGLCHEGRIIILEYEKTFLLCVYTPNSGIDGLKRLRWRCDVWDDMFGRLIGMLHAKGKQVIVMGDLNVVRHRIDAFRMDSSKGGMTEDERVSFDSLLKSQGLVDVYREQHPVKDTVYPYTWHYPSSPSAGYRLDYSLVSKSLLEHATDSAILGNYKGSDHKPILLRLAQQAL